MAEVIPTRSSLQCRSHHQKMLILPNQRRRKVKLEDNSQPTEERIHQMELHAKAEESLVKQELPEGKTLKVEHIYDIPMPSVLTILYQQSLEEALAAYQQQQMLRLSTKKEDH